MRINEKYQQIKECEKIDFDECSKYIYFGENPYEKYQQIEKCEESILMNAGIFILVKTLFM